MSEIDIQRGPKIIYGGFPIPFLEGDQVDALYKVLKDNDVDEIDTARIYENSEKVIGELGWSKKFTIDTKAPGFGLGRQDEEGINASIKESLSLLKVPSVEIYYLHSPDPTTPIEEVLRNVNELFKQGKFKRFGISNFSPSAVRELYEIAKSHDYVLPTVYQGNYNAFSRKNEEDLFPVLRELDIPFYAYSPVAGGFLLKTSEEILGNKTERFKEGTSIGDHYRSLYVKKPLLKALDQFGEIAEKHNIRRLALAYRWIVHNSSLDATKGDAVIVGGRTAEQLSKTLSLIKDGPLPKGISSELDEIWSSIREFAPRDNLDAL